MNERIKEIRNRLDMTQQEFSKKLNMSRSNLCSIEAGRVNLTSRTINDICEKFHINEHWLKTGEGEMFNIIDENELFNKTLAEWIMDCDPITKKTVLSLRKLSKEEFEFVSKMLDGLLRNKKD